ncbi:tRNA glutamyl-Q(34) synthetase GluQRS [Arcanobacterium sp. S3PF19]|uniref:tRNA glutamyl-Q(34) synthetase GluQRS n=1 Tax=Arcanobacterium sp. S3PF19 TaxID=1219585 RepID=UPI000A0497E0|nr:tRNA glutamyl-Q(34) synthetase GluQRS [Arcanobacterium sp. S3PF19]
MYGNPDQVTAGKSQPGHSASPGEAKRGAGRYAPSPSGELHVGNLRTALLAWALARHDGLEFRLRIEDLDERSRAAYEAVQLRDLELLGIDWDGEIIRQSRRLDIYTGILDGLRRRGLLYECYCTRRDLAQVASAPHRPPGSYPGTCRNLTAEERAVRLAKLEHRGPALRLKTDTPAISLHDRFCGDYTGAVDDLVLCRGDGVFSYNFTAIVDDALMGITQIVRGDDLLPSTPRQIYLQRILGYGQPEYAHVPLVLNSRGVRLAKRDGAVTLGRLRDLGVGVPDLLEKMSVSLGFPPVGSAEEFLSVFSPEQAVLRPWMFSADMFL